MCPGWLSYAEPGDEDIIEEFKKQKELWWPILRNIIPTTILYSEIVEILNILSEYVLDEDFDDIPFNDPNQSKLEF